MHETNIYLYYFQCNGNLISIASLSYCGGLIPTWVMTRCDPICFGDDFCAILGIFCHNTCSVRRFHVSQQMCDAWKYCRYKLREILVGECGQFTFSWKGCPPDGLYGGFTLQTHGLTHRHVLIPTRVVTRCDLIYFGDDFYVVWGLFYSWYLLSYKISSQPTSVRCFVKL